MDKAPARAASILFGLGFTPEEQRQPTRYLFFLNCFVDCFQRDMLGSFIDELFLSICFYEFFFYK